MAEKKQQRWKLIINIFTFVALFVLIYAVRHQVGQTVSNLGKVNAWALLLMLPAQLMNYDAYARMYRYLFAVLDAKVSYRSMFRVTLELNLVNHAFPSGGVSGFSYFGLRLKNFDVRGTQATLVQGMRFILVFISFQLFLFLGLILLAIDGKVNNFLLLVAGSLSTLLVIGTIAGAYIIGSKERMNKFFTSLTKVANRIIHIVRPHHPETINIQRVEHLFDDLHENYMIFKRNPRALKWPLIHSLFANLGEVLTVYVVYIAFGAWVNPGAVIIAYAVANFAGLISVLPGGVGTFEALMTAVLASAGVSPGLSIPVTIMYRVLNRAIQLPPGYYYYHKAVGGHLVSTKS